MHHTSPLGRTWDDASSPAAARLARRFENDWRDSDHFRPDPLQYLPENPTERSGAWLALLRAELALRWESHEPIRVEDLLARYPDLDDQILVALLYEEFCLREESGLTPDPAEFERRFPHLASQLRRVLEIHELVGGSGQTTATYNPDGVFDDGTPFPKSGQTIAGFHLVEELGRGAFARVFRAEERQLADRPVALKVARSGSREPQTLARLQHTHIVPVYSYKTDPVTGLHLLCMPYFGRVTLSSLLSDSAVQNAWTGGELIEALERLEQNSRPPLTRPEAPKRPEPLELLARLSYPRAIAWWGARLAEALRHAHERGVLHRDVKPSNVLVTGDGVPMLLDFNLAHESRLDATEPNALGGTLSYMAPEHLEALADGVGDQVDTRADLYALGVVLFEALTAKRPFPGPKSARSVPEALLRAAEQRRVRPPRLQRFGVPIPPPLEAVVQRCLAPDPDDRYASAAELALDLQAVVDDVPLRHAREPLASRSVRWLRRNRVRFAVAAPLALTALLLASSYHDARVARIERASQIKDILNEGRALKNNEEFDRAIERFKSAEQLAEGRHEFLTLAQDARSNLRVAEEAKEWRAKADSFFRHAERLRFQLLGFVGDPQPPFHEIRAALKPFFVLENAKWYELPHISLLDDDQQRLLPIEVNRLLFLWAVALDRNHRDNADARALAVRLCDRVLMTLAVENPRRAPWLALRSQLQQDEPQAPVLPQPRPIMRPANGAESDLEALAAFLWGVYHRARDDNPRAILWLERACVLQPSDYWARFYLAACNLKAGRLEDALIHADVAVALRPQSAWALFNRAEAYRNLQDWDHALDDLEQALAVLPPEDRDDLGPRIQLNRGLVRYALGDLVGARSDYVAVRLQAPGTNFEQAARFNLARLDTDLGRFEQALFTYEDLINASPSRADARYGRALLALRLNLPERAEADLSFLLKAEPQSAQAAEWFSLRALARLAQGRAEDADADATQAARLQPTPARERLRLRTTLALGAVEQLGLEDPETLRFLPAAGPALTADLHAALARLQQEEGGESSTSQRLTRAILRAALGDPNAEDDATAVLDDEPMSRRALLVRARIRRAAGKPAAALRDVEEGLVIAPDDPALLALRGILRSERGDLPAGLADLERAMLLGNGALSTRQAKARTLARLGRFGPAIAEWTAVLDRDPEAARAYLERARVLLQAGAHDQALVDLEQAIGWSGQRPELLAPITWTYASCLVRYPDRLPRVLTLARRTVEEFVRGFSARSSNASPKPNIPQPPWHRSFATESRHAPLE